MARWKDKSTVLISKDKTKFILISEKNGNPVVTSNFKIHEGIVHPSLQLEMNRLLRTRNLLESIPGAFHMSSNGKCINIDTISEILTFNKKDLSGIIQYEICNQETFENSIIALYNELKVEPLYVTIEENDSERTFQPSTLKVYPITFNEGAMISIVDAVEKFLHCPIIDGKTGLLGVTAPADYPGLKIFQDIWPELELSFTIKNDKMEIVSELIQKQVDVNHPCFIKVFRTFGTSDLEIQITHGLGDWEKQLVGVHDDFK